MTGQEKAALNKNTQAAFKAVQHPDFRPVRALAQHPAPCCAVCFAHLRSGFGYLVGGFRVCRDCNTWHHVGLMVDAWRERRSA